MKFSKQGAPECFSHDKMRNASSVTGSNVFPLHRCIFFLIKRGSVNLFLEKTSGKNSAVFIDQIVKQYFYLFWLFLKSYLLVFQ